MTEPNFVVTDHPEANRFEMHRDGELVGFADYRVRGNTLAVPHVETLRPHRGQGYGARLMDGLLEIIRADGRRIDPICPFAAGHIAADPSLHELRAD
ncbi:MAG: GNAT family N-acetyltransferase [Acidimicrobiales bacterium]